MKICSLCNCSKDYSEFLKSKETKDGLGSWCKPCRKEYNIKYRMDNDTKLKELSKKYYINNRNHIRNRSKNRYHSDKKPEILLKGSIRKKTLWSDPNFKAKHAAQEAKRKGIKLKATPKWLTKEHLNEIKEIYLECQLLSDMFNFDGYGYHVDHIMPLKGIDICGLHVPWNLRIIPAIENYRKGNRIN